VPGGGAQSGGGGDWGERRIQEVEGGVEIGCPPKGESQLMKTVKLKFQYFHWIESTRKNPTTRDGRGGREMSVWEKGGGNKKNKRNFNGCFPNICELKGGDSRAPPPRPLTMINHKTSISSNKERLREKKKIWMKGGN